MSEVQQAQGIFRIRRMTPEDLEQVAEIDQISFTQPWPRDSFKFELYSNPVARLWVAEKLPEETPAHVIAIMVIWVVFDEAHKLRNFYKGESARIASRLDAASRVVPSCCFRRRRCRTTFRSCSG